MTSLSSLGRMQPAARSFNFRQRTRRSRCLPFVGALWALVVLFAIYALPARGQANVTGQWKTLPTQMPINPVHVALMHNGQVLIVSGSGNVANYYNYEAAVWNPATDTVTTLPVNWDMFCNGMIIFEDGRPFILGGTRAYDPFLGEVRTSAYDPATGMFNDMQPMAHGRWYPTATTLNDGSVMVFSGLDENSNTNDSVEIYRLGIGWSVPYLAPWTPPLYPRMHLLPNGSVFYSGSTIGSAIFNPTNQTWQTNVYYTNYPNQRTYGSSVLLPLTPANNYKPVVMIMGGGNPATATTEIIDLSVGSPKWVYGPNMSAARIEMDATMLPNGKILVDNGSVNDEDATTASLNADLYDPGTNTFSSAGAEAYPRLYHSGSLLLPDATVLILGGNPSRGTYEPHMEIYSPPYLFNSDGSLATRPSISGVTPSVIGYGSSLQIQTPDAANISSVALVRLGAVTHAFDMEQRLVGLTFTAGSGVLNAIAPPTSSIAPPGYYLLFILNSSGVPSVGQFVQLSLTPNDQPPTGIISSPSGNVMISPGQFVSFSGGGTSPNGTIAEYSWVFPSGNPGMSSLANPGSVTFSQSGTFVASLTVTDNNGVTDPSPKTRTITVTAAPPTITSLSATSGPVGTAVTINGTNFGSTQGTSTVTFNGTAATVTSWSSSSLSTSVPTGATTGNVVVTVGGVASNGLNFTVTTAAPVITSGTTASGTVGVAFSYQITATNSPTSYGATGLPAGLSVNTSSGLISGTPSGAGTSTVTLSATNGSGTGHATLTLTISTVVTVSSVQVVATAASGSASTLSLSFAQNTVAGDLILVAFDYDTNTTPSSVTDSQGNVFTPIGNQLTSPGGARSRVYYAKNIKGGADRVTVNLSANSGWLELYLSEYTGVDQTNPIDAQAGASGGAGAVTSGNATTTVAGDVIYGYCVGDYACTAGSGFATRSNLNGNLIEDRLAGTAGTYAATGSANNGWSMQMVALKPASSGVGAPVITSGTTASGTVGVAFSYQITATNSPTSYGATGLPAGLSVNTSSGLISGTPSGAGTSTVTLSATNGSGTGNATLALTIAAAAPVITSGTTASGTVGVAFSYQITATNSPTSYGATGLPAGLSVNTSSGLISGTPSGAGTSTVTLSATNGSGTGNATLTVTIAAAAPVITSGTTASGTVGVAFSYQITATNSPTSYGATGLPAGLSVNTSSGLISGTPSGAGTSTVTLSATNGSGTGNATLTLTIAAAAPVITSGTTASGTVGVAFSYQITATNSPTSYGATGLPAGLSVNTSSGLISGTPSGAGTSTVTLSATNGSGTGHATLTLTISTVVTVSSVQVVATAASGSASTLSLSFAQNTVAGDLILVAFDYDTNATPSSVTDSQGNVFTPIGNQLTSPGGARSRVYYAKNIKGGADKVTVNLSANSGWLELYLSEYTGVDQTNPIDAQAGASGGAGAVTSGNGTTSVAGDVIYGYCVADWACTAGSGFITRSNLNANLIEDELAGTAGTYAATGSANNGWTMQMVALKP